MSFKGAISGALRVLNVALGRPTFTWKGTAEVPCVPNSDTEGSVVIIGGKELAIDFSLFVLQSEFITVDSTLHTVDGTLWTVDNDRPHPVTGMTLVYIGQTYRIFRVKSMPDRSSYRLDVGDPNQ